jgi:hypothetical protein
MDTRLLRRKIKRSQLVGLLSPTLGHDRSDQLVAGTARDLGVPVADDVRVDHVLQILDRLGTAEGMVGVAARFVRVRGELEAMIGGAPDSLRSQASFSMTVVPTPMGGVPSLARQPAVPRVTLEEISVFVAPAVGDVVARDAVASHAAKLGLSGQGGTRAEAAAILDSMSKVDGILGVVASFAKARFLLKYPL